MFDGNVLGAIGMTQKNEEEEMQSESLHEISCESDSTYPKETPNSDHVFYNRDSFNCSNFLDVDWLSSSGNSCEDETYER